VFTSVKTIDYIGAKPETHQNDAQASTRGSLKTSRYTSAFK